MGNTMTVNALGKFFMNRGTVGFSMAIHADRQMPVLRMTLGTGKCRVLCLTRLKQIEGLFMTTGTDLFTLGLRVGDIQRGMHRMTGQAVRGIQHYNGAVILVAFRTLRDAAVFLRMTGGAFLLSMHADLIFQAGGNVGMAMLAAVLNVGRIRDGCQGLMRVGVTCETLCHRFIRTMKSLMAAGTFGHDFRVIFTQRIVGMKHLVTFGTGNCLVPGAIITQPVVMC